MPTPDRTSLVEIVAAGRTILEAEGAVGVTMRAVAERVGVRAPSLYKRVADRDALLAAIATVAIDDLRAALRQAGSDLASLAAAYRAFAYANPEAFRLMLSPLAPLDALQRAAEPVIDACTPLVGADDSLSAARMFTAWATGFLQMELAGAFRLGGDVNAAFDYAIDHLIGSLGKSAPA